MKRKSSRTIWGFLIIVLCGLSASCVPWMATTTKSGSVGTTSCGALVDGTHLPAANKNYRFYRKFDRRYATAEMASLIVEVADNVAKKYPGPPLLVGDISGKGGGFISEHSSHRSGRDVDFAFFTTHSSGETTSGYPLAKFDRFGVGIREKKPVRFDVARNWEVVESMLSSDTAHVQWIFVSNGLKGALLHYAISQGRDVEIIERAVSVLHQPGDSAPHDDHFHVRIYCPRDSDTFRCTDRKPFWPWILEQDKGNDYHLTDEDLLELALGELPA